MVKLAGVTQTLEPPDIAVSETAHSDCAVVGWAIAVFAVLSAVLAVTSKGFLESDGCTHYLYARWSISQPYYRLDVWGRPVCTFLYSIPALIGHRLGVRFTSLLVAIGVALTTYRIAKLQNLRWAALAVIFTFAQPLVFTHSFAELTELPFALLVAVAFLAYRERRWWELALVVGVMPLARPEGSGFIAMALVALVCHRRFQWIPLLFIPLVLWDWAGWTSFGSKGVWWRWLIENWPYAENSLYARGHLLQFTAALPAIVGPFVFPAMVIGVWLCLWQPRVKLFFRDHDHRCRILIAVIPLAILAVHSLLYWRGKMASNGELRYMLVVAPFWALLAAMGWGWMFERFEWRRVYRFAALAALLPLVANVFYKVLPIKLQADWVKARAIAQWYQSSDAHARYPRIVGAHPAIWYYLDLDPLDSQKSGQWSHAIVDHPQAGTILVFDSLYSLKNASAGKSIGLDEIEKAGWVEVEKDWVPKVMSPKFEFEEGEWHLFVAPAALSAP